jgi:HEAT repeat protein
VGSGKEHWERVAMLARLGDGAGPVDPAPLYQVLDDERECWHTKCAALESLWKLRPARAGAAVVRLLARKREPSIRQAAIEALVQLREHKALRLLERLVAEDPSAEVRAAARRALDHLAKERC